MPPTPSVATRLLKLASKRGVLRARDVTAAGLPRSYLERLTARCLLVKTGRGLYMRADAPVTEFRSLAQVAVKAPGGVICLLSALRFHGLTTQAPFEVWLALPPGAWAPAGGPPAVRVVRMGGAALELGVEKHGVDGVTVRVFSAAKTVVDCFRFRNKVGLDVALEALREFRRERGNLDEVLKLARKLRAANVMRPYLEATS